MSQPSQFIPTPWILDHEIVNPCPRKLTKSYQDLQLKNEKSGIIFSFRVAI